VLGACPHDCPDTCALVTTVRDGVAVKVQGNAAHSPPAACCAPRCRATPNARPPERLLQPLKRVGPKGSGQFEPVSWDSALDDIAAASRIAARDPQTILPYSYCGTMGLVQGESMAGASSTSWARRCWTAPSARSAGGEAMVQTLGGKVGMKVEFFAEAKLILIWGSNAITSNLHFWRLAQEAKRKGARLVCIDPRRTETAEKCHEHVQLLPGTDAALALALMHELIVHDWLDHDYIAQPHAGLGSNCASARCAGRPRARPQVCGMPAEQIRALARPTARPSPRPSA
jgi:anaerobic selenocysteine-containing dehydrogenase